MQDQSRFSFLRFWLENKLSPSTLKKQIEICFVLLFLVLSEKQTTTGICFFFVNSAVLFYELLVSVMNFVVLFWNWPTWQNSSRICPLFLSSWSRHVVRHLYWVQHVNDIKEIKNKTKTHLYKKETQATITESSTTTPRRSRIFVKLGYVPNAKATTIQLNFMRLLRRVRGWVMCCAGFVTSGRELWNCEERKISFIVSHSWKI